MKKVKNKIMKKMKWKLRKTRNKSKMIIKNKIKDNKTNQMKKWLMSKVNQKANSINPMDWKKIFPSKKWQKD